MTIKVSLMRGPFGMPGYAASSDEIIWRTPEMDEAMRAAPDALAPGDIVMLKSGGPRMVVNRVGPIDVGYEDELPAGMVEVAWFAEEASVGVHKWGPVGVGIFHRDALDLQWKLKSLEPSND